MHAYVYIHFVMVISGHLQRFGRISRADFERLVSTGLADADAAHLTFTEYFYQSVKKEIGGIVTHSYI